MSHPDAAAAINEMHRGTWAEKLGLHMVSATRDGITATFDVRPDHLQPHGIVHGGVYASVIESVASVGAALDAMTKGKTVVGLDNHTSFVRAVRGGTLHATGTPVTRGRRSQLWDVVLRDAKGAIVASGRVRLLVLEPDAEVAGSPIGSR